MRDTARYRTVNSPFGPLRLTEIAGQVAALDWSGQGDADSPVLRQAEAELAGYFAGDVQCFTVPIRLAGTAFHRAFLQALIDIPFGETLTYGDLAKRLGVSSQAIGQACGANPIPILIPCHRVLSANDLGGYSGAGGIETKVALLKHEGAAGLLL